ncbi:MAG: hypothetical protein ABIZ04_15555 [Opitutus sp.]
MLPRVDTKNAQAVAAWVQQVFCARFPGCVPDLMSRVFLDVETLFGGNHPDYQAVDLRYHDFEHTLQATLCLGALLNGYVRSNESPRLDARHFELGIAAVLLHDTGYLKLRSDTQGTGAKYTYCHVLRSCAFAASYLPLLGANEIEISGVVSAINCTGPTSEIARLQFRNSADRFIGSALASADYLGQMAAPDYPDELECLFAEFAESDDFTHVPPAGRLFKSADDLTARTPAFWKQVVRPKLENEFQGTYRFLRATGFNDEFDYVSAVERNIERIRRQTASSATSTR